jgi:hypothetical protein
MPFPTTEDLPLTVRMAFGADLTADPASWSFTDMSDRLVDTPITITKGAASGGQATASMCDLDLENTDGELSPDNALSTLWPDVDVDVPVEVLAGSGDSSRFEGFASALRPDFVPSTDGTPLSVLHISAAGILQRLTQASQSKPLGSPLRRTMAGVSPDDFQPLAYWPMEDESGATRFASALPGGAPGTVAGTVSFAADDDLVGSQPLPDFAASSSATFRVPGYTLTNRWIVQLMVRPTATTGALFRVSTNGTGTSAVVSLNFSTNEIGLSVTDSAGSSLLSTTASIPDVRGQWVSISLSSRQNVSAQTLFDITMITNNGTSTYGTGAFAVLAAYGNVTAVSLIPSVAAGFGHVGLFVDPSFSAGGGDDVYNARAMGGWAGETTVERWNRVLTEERVRHSVTGASATTMGAQPVDASLLDIMSEIEAAEQGAIAEKNWGVDLICAQARYNLPVGLTVDLSTYRTSSGSAGQVLTPNYSFQGYRNQWTVERSNGSFAIARASDAEIRKRNLYDESITVNLGTDAVLPDHASWRLNRDLQNRVRYPDTPVDIGENTVVDAGFIDDWFALEPGVSRIQRTNVPGLHGAGTIDEMLNGYTERLERRRLRVNYNGSPYAPYEVGVYGVDPGGIVSRYGALTTFLAEDLTSVETAADVAAGTDTWATTASHPSRFPFNVTIGGLVYSCTGITGTAPNYTLTLVRLPVDRTHATGTQVLVGADHYGL